MLRTGRLTFLIALQVGAAIHAQAPKVGTFNPEKMLSAPGVVHGRPFSAIKYTRTVQVQPNGRRIVKAEAHHLLLARDKDGRILLSGADRSSEHCDLPSLGKLPTCDFWALSLFEPAKATMWHWMDGEIGDPTQLVQMDLTEDQMAQAERLTSVISTPLLTAHEPEAGVKLDDLGERTIEGIRAKGFRTTATHAVSGSSETRQIIHEVWVAADMRLVLRVVDGDPKGEETVSGLSHISLSPAPSLFQPPLSRTVRHWPDSSKYAVSDLDCLLLWEVK